MGVSITELNAPTAAASDSKASAMATTSKDSTSKSSNSSRPGDEEDGKPWTFRCKCGEVCSSYEKEMYHPAGQWYECSQCSVWSHVHCMLGKATPEQILEMKEVLCFSCTTKARRSRSRGTVEEVLKVELPPAPAALPATAATHREETCLAGPTVYPGVSAALLANQASTCLASQCSEVATGHVAAPASGCHAECGHGNVVSYEQAALLQQPVDLPRGQETKVAKVSNVDDEVQEATGTCDVKASTVADAANSCTELLASKRKHDFDDEREVKAACVAQPSLDEL